MGNGSSAARLGEKAVVVGAGMGGTMAAEALSGFFDHVIVLDKDTLPNAAEPRRGVPQGQHVHTLLVQGRNNLEHLFPGYTERLLARGATWTALLKEFKIRDAAGWFPERDVGLHMLTASRPLLEGTAREFLAHNPKVEIRDQTAAVSGWRMNGQAVTGVILGDDNHGEVIPADLVVDASGRSGGSTDWLKAAGFGAVEETTIEIGIVYASAVFRRPAGWAHGDDMILFGGDPLTGERSAGIFSIEDDRWLVSLIGRFDQQPSADPDKFMEFAKGLEESVVYDWISQAERLTPIRMYRPHLSKWRRYDRLDRFPEGLLPLGDAIAHVNPARGQGMTLASAHAISLLNVLGDRARSDGGLSGLAKSYFERVQGFTETVWGGLETM